MDHICVKDCNVSRLVIPSQTGKQSNTLFLKNQFWRLFFSKRSHFIFVSWTCLLNTVYRWNNIVTKMFKNNFELQSWFKSNYLRHLSGEESNTKPITIINHDTIWLNQQAGKVKRTCFYCLFLVFIYYLFIFFFALFWPRLCLSQSSTQKNNLANIQPSQLSSRVVNNA